MIFVKQNNFDKKATEFVEAHRSIGNSIIYDYQIDHQDGSILKIFMTGEPLNEAGRRNLYVYAKEHGIDEEQIVIKEYITQSSSDNDEVFKGIYDRLDSKIGHYEITIDQLNRELQTIKKKELPYKQIASEISVSYPGIKHVYIGQGNRIDIDSMKVTPCLIVKIQPDTLMSESSLEQFKRWLEVRLQTENIELDCTPAK